MTYEHVADLAELYALGALADDERAAVDAHLRVCAACAGAIGAAEEDVARIAAADTQWNVPPALADRVDGVLQERPLRPRARARAATPAWQFAALAAALVLGLLPSAYLWSANRAMHDAMLTQSAAVERLASVPHRTTAFRSSGEPIGAAVMYPSDGSWYVVLVRDASRAMQVAWMHDGERTMLGSAVPRGGLAMLYLPKSHPMGRLALMDGDRIVAEATLPWQKTTPSRQGARSE
jgi:anti-sigma factor RsiW